MSCVPSDLLLTNELTLNLRNLTNYFWAYGCGSYSRYPSLVYFLPTMNGLNHGVNLPLEIFRLWKYELEASKMEVIALNLSTYTIVPKHTRSLNSSEQYFRFICPWCLVLQYQTWTSLRKLTQSARAPQLVHVTKTLIFDLLTPKFIGVFLSLSSVCACLKYPGIKLFEKLFYNKVWTERKTDICICNG